MDPGKCLKLLAAAYSHDARKTAELAQALPIRALHLSYPGSLEIKSSVCHIERGASMLIHFGKAVQSGGL
jgi:hypothetical protein